MSQKTPFFVVPISISLLSTLSLTNLYLFQCVLFEHGKQDYRVRPKLQDCQTTQLDVLDLI